MNSFYNEPNETILSAIEEARAGKSAGTIDTSSTETFIKSCEWKCYIAARNIKKISKNIEISLRNIKSFWRFY